MSHSHETIHDIVEEKLKAADELERRLNKIDFVYQSGLYYEERNKAKQLREEAHRLDQANMNEIDALSNRLRQDTSRIYEIAVALANVILPPQPKTVDTDPWLAWVRAMRDEARTALEPIESPIISLLKHERDAACDP